VGKASKGPERELCARYADRASRIGRGIGLSKVEVREVADGHGPGRAEAEGADLLARVPAGPLVALDERGDLATSAGLAALVQKWLDDGERAATFAIGGADGHAPAVRNAARETLSFGRITLPHLLARAILLEQIYRALTIRLGHPYHRE
jgi:23S rRNA (pseudouridine1915-N3)-methyltransferase